MPQLVKSQIQIQLRKQQRSQIQRKNAKRTANANPTSMMLNPTIQHRLITSPIKTRDQHSTNQLRKHPSRSLLRAQQFLRSETSSKPSSSTKLLNCASSRAEKFKSSASQKRTRRNSVSSSRLESSSFTHSPNQVRSQTSSC